MKKLRCIYCYAFIGLLVIAGCGSSGGGEDTTQVSEVSGTITLPSNVTDKCYVVVLDLDDDPDNDIIDAKLNQMSGSKITYLFDNVPDGTYNVYAAVDVDQSGGTDCNTFAYNGDFITPGDYWGYYGGTGLDPPSVANMPVPHDDGLTCNFSLAITFIDDDEDGYIDDDEDGYTEDQGDCNDSDAGINSGATEICGDGIDQNCSGSDEICPVSEPENVQATAGAGVITVSWDTVSDADSYNVYWSTNQGDGTSGTAIAVTGTTLSHEKLIYGQDYYYVVTAVNITGESAPSAEATNTPDRKLISSITSTDANLETCVTDEVNFYGITYVDELIVLGCGSWGITDLTGIGWFTNLQYLSLSDNSISDISALSGLTNLQYLSLSDNSISDISALSGLTNLQTLWLWSNSISDISALSGLTNLQYLSLSDNSISDISALSGLANLQYLSLWGNSISDISVLAGLTNLQNLDLSGNSITTGVVDLVTLTSAELIDLRSNPNIPCSDLDTLEDALVATVINRDPVCAL